MKWFLFSLMLVIAPYASAQPTGVPDGEEIFDDDVLPASPLDEVAGSLYPEVGGRSFDLVNASVSMSMPLSCNGFGDFQLFTQLGGQLKELFSNIGSMLPGLAINFLVYSSPTLFSIYEFMNTRLDFLAGMNVTACGTVRQIATAVSKSDVSPEKLCMRAGGSAKACMASGPEYISSLERSREKLQATLNSWSEGVGEAPKDLLDAIMKRIPRKNTKAQGKEKQREIIQEEYRAKWVELIPVRRTEQSGDSETESGLQRGKSLEDVYLEYNRKYVDLLSKATSNKNINIRSNAYNDLSVRAGPLTPSRAEITRIAELYKRSRTDWAKTISGLATELSLSTVRLIVLNFKAEVALAKASGLAKLTTGESLERANSAVDLLDGELSQIELRYEGTEQIRERVRLIRGKVPEGAR